jgi:hypothetical protein
VTKQAYYFYFTNTVYFTVLEARNQLRTIVTGGAAPEAAEEPMETEGGAAVEPAAAAAADLPPPATAVASDPAPPPPGQSLARAFLYPVAGVLRRTLWSAKTAKRSSRTGPPVYIGWNCVHPM